MAVRLESGDPAPDFTLPNQDDKPVSLSAFHGRRVVVYFYPKDDTPGCTREACQFNDVLHSFSELGVDVLGISADPAASHQRFRVKYGLALELLTDADHAVMKTYGAFGEKKLYGKPVIGVIRSTFLIGASGKVERAWYGVRTDGHAAAVLAAL